MYDYQVAYYTKDGMLDTLSLPTFQKAKAYAAQLVKQGMTGVRIEHFSEDMEGKEEWQIN